MATAIAVLAARWLSPLWLGSAMAIRVAGRLRRPFCRGPAPLVRAWPDGSAGQTWDRPHFLHPQPSMGDHFMIRMVNRPVTVALLLVGAWAAVPAEAQLLSYYQVR